MRRRSRPPLNRRYFHTEPKIDKRDIATIKRKIDLISKRKYKEEQERRKKVSRF